VEDAIPLPNVKSQILAKVIEYCKYHVDASKKVDEKPAKSEDEIKQWDSEFVKVDQGTLFDLILVGDGAPQRRAAQSRPGQPRRRGLRAWRAGMLARGRPRHPAPASPAWRSCSCGSSCNPRCASLWCQQAGCARPAAGRPPPPPTHTHPPKQRPHNAAPPPPSLTPQAANYMNIKGLLDLTCQTVANMIKGKTPEEIRKTFNIKVGARLPWRSCRPARLPRPPEQRELSHHASHMQQRDLGSPGACASRCLQNDFTPEEEEEVRRENQWAFD
jgi:hypothetical protein